MVITAIRIAIHMYLHLVTPKLCLRSQKQRGAVFAAQLPSLYLPLTAQLLGLRGTRLRGTGLRGTGLRGTRLPFLQVLSPPFYKLALGNIHVYNVQLVFLADA
jgi:hypothetical protein